MGQVKTHRTRLQSTLLAIILATLPCYLLGLVVLWVGNAARDGKEATPTPTEVVPGQPVIFTPTQLVTATETPEPTVTLTPTFTATFTVTPTYALPTATPSHTQGILPTEILLTPEITSTSPIPGG